MLEVEAILQVGRELEREIIAEQEAQSKTAEQAALEQVPVEQGVQEVQSIVEPVQEKTELEGLPKLNARPLESKFGSANQSSSAEAQIAAAKNKVKISASSELREKTKNDSFF